MQLTRSYWFGFSLWLALILSSAEATRGMAGQPAPLEVGLAVRDISPELPIQLAGYAGRKQSAHKADHALVAQAMALRNPTGDRFVMVALDNCEVNHAFMRPVLEQITDTYQLARGSVVVVSSHTHSAPVLDGTLDGMTQPSPEDLESIQRYSRMLKAKLVEVVGAALDSFQPAQLERGAGQAAFAMNRRVYKESGVSFGDNPDGPTDWDVPVLRIKGTNGAVRAILFGYACHGTSVRGGDDWYVVSGEYMAYARQHLEAHEPGAMALFFPGMGADCDPAPRGRLLDAKRHGLELAGAVIGVLDRPMRPVRGPFKFAYEEVDLPFVTPPNRAQLEQDAAGKDVHVKRRAQNYLKLLDAGQSLPQSVKLPVAVLRLGDDLTFILVAGEVVVDYARRLKRLFAEDHPWTVGYAYEVPCYIPSMRVIKEGGYESESSLIYYGFYGPFKTGIEELLVNRLGGMVQRLRSQ